MNILVFVKRVPDTESRIRIQHETRTIAEDGLNFVISPYDEYAVEEALKLAEAHGGEVTILSMGPEKTGETIRKALSMGADKGVHVVDPALHGSDALVTSAVLAKALGTVEWDLVLLGVESTDARMSVLPAMLAERLGAPQLTLASSVEVDGTTVRVKRLTEAGYDTVEGSTPAVVGVVEKINEPRYPSFKGIMAAKKKPVTTLTLAELGLSADAAGTAGSWSAVVDFTPAPPRQAGTVVKDEGDGGAKIAEFLAGRKFI